MRARTFAWALLCAAPAVVFTADSRPCAEAEIALPAKPNGVERFAP